MRVVILGGGFAGLTTAKKLRKLNKNVDITLIDKKESFIYLPILHKVAANRLLPEKVKINYKKFASKNRINFKKEEAKIVDFDKKIIHLTKTKIGYDYLVLAVGSTTNFYGMKSWEKKAFGIKNLEETLRLRNHLENVFSKIHGLTNIKDKLDAANVIIIGGGLTGIQLAAELMDFICEKCGMPHKPEESIRITLINSKEHIPSGFPDRVVNFSEGYLMKNKINFKFSRKVVEVGDDYVKLDNGEIINGLTVFWAAGITQTDFIGSLKLEKGPDKAVLTNDFLEAKENVYVLGDCLFFRRGFTVMKTAQNAVKQASLVAKNINASINNNNKKIPYQPKPIPTIISLGRRIGVFSYKNIILKGRYVLWLEDLIRLIFFWSHR